MQKKRALIIFNPIAGTKGFLNTEQIIKRNLEKSGYEYDWFETVKASKQPMGKFAQNKYDLILVSGGDGTVAQAVSFMLDYNVKADLAIIPKGSANLLARALFLPCLDVRRSVKAAINGKGKKIDVMKINNKAYGLIAAGMGYDVLLMKETKRSMKRMFGFFAYVWTALKTFFFYRSKKYKLTIDGKRHQVVAKSILIFNVLPFGDLRFSDLFIGEKVSGRDGVLHVFVLNPRSIWDFFMFRKRCVILKGKKVELRQKRESRYQIDGDVFKGKSLKIEVIRSAVSVRVMEPLLNYSFGKGRGIGTNNK